MPVKQFKPITLEEFIRDLKDSLHITVKLELKTDSLLKQMRKNSIKKMDKDQLMKLIKEIKKFIKETTNPLLDKEDYFFERVEAIKEIQGNAKLEKKFEIAIKNVRGDKALVTTEEFLNTLEDLLCSATSSRLEAESLFRQMKKNPAKNMSKNQLIEFMKEPEKFIKKTAELLQESKKFFVDKIEAMEPIQKDEERRKDFNIVMKLLKEDKLNIFQKTYPKVGL